MIGRRWQQEPIPTGFAVMRRVHILGLFGLWTRHFGRIPNDELGFFKNSESWVDLFMETFFLDRDAKPVVPVWKVSFLLSEVQK